MPSIPRMDDFMINIDMNLSDDIAFKWLKHVYDASVSELQAMENERSTELANWESGRASALQNWEIERDAALAANSEAVVAEFSYPEFEYRNQSNLDYEKQTNDALVVVLKLLKGDMYLTYTPETYTRG